MINKPGSPESLNMDVIARDGTILRLNVTLTPSGHVQLDSELKIGECGATGIRHLVGYKVEGFLTAADDRGQLTLHDQIPGLTIERHWMTAAADWLQMLAEDLTDAKS